MFPRDSGIEWKIGFLISERIFRSGKRWKTLLEWESCNTDREEEGYKFASYLDQGSCDEEEEYQLIS